jgi:hypothetical protein
MNVNTLGLNEGVMEIEKPPYPACDEREVNVEEVAQNKQDPAPYWMAGAVPSVGVSL